MARERNIASFQACMRSGAVQTPPVKSWLRSSSCRPEKSPRKIDRVLPPPCGVAIVFYDQLLLLLLLLVSGQLPKLTAVVC